MTLFSKGIMFVLLFMSVISWAIIIYKSPECSARRTMN
jgi:biopolymer transport protein ExbB/TolQ